METMIDDTVVSLAMGQRSSSGHDPSDFRHIALLFGKSSYDLLEDFVEDRSFTTLHEVLLGFRHDYGTLDAYLASFGNLKLPPEVIDVPDSCGRTALAWAVEYGWAAAVRALLKYGANPHQLRPCIHGKSPLLHLVIAGPASQSSDAGFLEVVRALLESGVDVNAVDHEGWTSLHVAASWNHYDVIKELAACGAGVLHWDSLTDNKQSAIELALNAGFDSKVQYVLRNHVPVEDHPIETKEEDKYSCDSLSDDDHAGIDCLKDDLDGMEDQFFDAMEVS
jgi:Ankyrin repeats (many copies)/Ankyrin repeat